MHNPSRESNTRSTEKQTVTQYSCYNSSRTPHVLTKRETRAILKNQNRIQRLISEPQREKKKERKKCKRERKARREERHDFARSVEVVRSCTGEWGVLINKNPILLTP
jgi:phage/plasmid primase-like uncharacterized protein